MIDKAIQFAYEKHKGMIRKDGTPYISHPFEVALTLAKGGADDNLICAGLLHDTIEDAKVTKEELIKEFNEDIANLVIQDSEDKSEPWEERKKKVIDSLKNSSDRYKMLILADKLSNLRSIVTSEEKDGEMIWSKFKRGKKEQEWFFSELLKASSSIKDNLIYKEYETYFKKIFKGE